MHRIGGNENLVIGETSICIGAVNALNTACRNQANTNETMHEVLVLPKACRQRYQAAYDAIFCGAWANECQLYLYYCNDI